MGTNGDGSSDFAEQNVISGNSLTGLQVEGAGTDSNIVAGNLIGLNAAATAAIANGTHGIRITNGARFTRVGTDGGANGGAEWNIISGNVSNGVMIDGAATSQTSVAGNYIGTNGGGMTAIPNAQGVYIDAGASSNTIGNPAVAGNIISGNFFNGVVLINGAAGNLVSTNWIGIDRTGAGDLGNNDDGVHVLNAAGNTISSNLISGNNRNGVWLWQSGSSGNVVSFNQIGTDIGGTLDRGNSGDGVRIENAAGNTVGGNVISGNNSDGVEITGGGATGNWLSGNYVGTNAAGTSAVGNTGLGVLIQNGAANTRIGTDANGVNDSAERNVISGNALGVGIYSGASATTVAGNYMGTNAAGTAAIPNADDAVFMNGANGVVIGGPAAAARNLASGNNGDGFEFFNSTGVVIQGNYVGTNADGTAAIRNRFYGVRVPQSAGGVITGNLISGNGDLGLELWGPATTNTTVSGNLIGTNFDGTAALPNGTIGGIGGVWVRNGASNNTISGNVVSGNVGSGVRFDDAATTGNAVTGNRIGTNAAGTAAVPNADLAGISIINSPNNTIGGTTPTARNVISGNALLGVSISGATATGNRLLGNYVGLDAGGTFAIPNGSDGVRISAASGNTIGGTAPGSGNVISGNAFDGIDIRLGATNNLVQGNLVGTDFSGLVAVGNGASGVNIEAAAGTTTGNTVGGTAPEARNVISGNLGVGVILFTSGTGQVTGNFVRGNYIGTDVTGAAGLGNGSDGVRISDATGNTVGGSTAADRNVISGNGGDGVEFSGVGTTDNLVAGNYIGTDAGGSVVLGNLVNGVRISDGAFNNTIGGGAVGAGNVISGNYGNGIQIVSSHSNVVAGNYIGLNADGTAALGNVNGVRIDTGASGNRIGTDGNGVDDDLERNVISGNNDDGIDVSLAGTSNNVIAGNYIGTDPTGTLDLGNLGHGVRFQLGASNNTVGGTTAATRNVISGNDRSGVLIIDASTSGNVVAGNFIGTTAAGTAGLGNSQAGVVIANASGNRVGGLTAAERNVISGNGTEGVAVTGVGATNNTVQGNYIGTNADGTAAVPNASFGLLIAEGSSNVIGGTAPGAGNVISGGARDGIGITGVSNSNNQVVGNLIGLNAAGTAALGNALNGVFVSAGGNNFIQGNVISGNGQSGVALDGSTSGNRIQGNRIGTDSTGTAAQPNLGHGVLISGAANGNVIGTDGNGANDAAEANTIAFNTLTGVTVTGVGTTGNSIRRNTIDANGGLGIDLNAGGNNTQASPVITGAVPGISTSLSGRMTGAPSTTFTIEFYASPTADPSGYGEGTRYLGSITVTTDANGNVAFSTVLVGVSTVKGEVITATATDPGGNTSEFSLAVVAKATAQVLITAVNNLPDFPQKGSLLSKLDNIQKHIDAGRPDVAINMLYAFIHEVEALVRGGTLTPEQAGLILDLTALLIDELDG